METEIDENALLTGADGRDEALRRMCALLGEVFAVIAPTIERDCFCPDNGGRVAVSNFRHNTAAIEYVEAVVRRALGAPSAARSPEASVAELDEALADLGRVTGLSGVDLFQAAAGAVRHVASEVMRAAAPYGAARTKAINDLEWLLGSVGPTVLDHAASPEARKV